MIKAKSFGGYKKGYVFSKEEIDEAKTTGIKVMQKEMFPAELDALVANKRVETKNRKLNLYLDNGEIRCRGRLGNLLEGQESSNPKLVNGGHPFVRSLIRHHHVHYNCGSKRYTLNRVRKMMHGPNLQTAVKTECRNCYLCKYLRSQPYAYPNLPPLSPRKVNS